MTEFHHPRANLHRTNIIDINPLPLFRLVLLVSSRPMEQGIGRSNGGRTIDEGMAVQWRMMNTGVLVGGGQWIDVGVEQGGKRTERVIM